MDESSDTSHPDDIPASHPLADIIAAANIHGDELDEMDIGLFQLMNPHSHSQSQSQSEVYNTD